MSSLSGSSEADSLVYCIVNIVMSHDPTTRKYITYYAFTSNPNIQARLENPNLSMISTDRVTPPEICCCNILSSTFVLCPSECHHQFSGVQSDSARICGDSSSDYVSRPRQLLRLFICFSSDVKENKAEGRIQCLKLRAFWGANRLTRTRQWSTNDLKLRHSPTRESWDSMGNFGKILQLRS